MTTLLPSRNSLFDPFEQFFDSVVDRMFSDSSKLKTTGSFPRLDIIANDGEWIIEVSAPGHKAEDVQVEILPNSMLRLSGRMSQDNRYDQSATFYKREIKRSGWERCITLPEYVKGDPEASMQNGILRLVWKVKELEKPKPKLIEVKNKDTPSVS
jgi:HSP20 family protein